MTGQEHDSSLTPVQLAADRLVNAKPEERPSALDELVQTILELHSIRSDRSARDELFSRELHSDVQRFAAVWLLRILSKSPYALDFEGTAGLAASMFDRVFQNAAYRPLNLDPGAQTFEKLKVLTDHVRRIFEELDDILSVQPNLPQLNGLQQRFMASLNNRSARPFLVPLLPRALINATRLLNLFQATNSYVESNDVDPIHKRDYACSVCDEFQRDAFEHGTTDAVHILGRLADGLKAAILADFDSSEASKRPSITVLPIAKKYPLERVGSNIAFKIRIRNDGTGPARELRLDDIASDVAIQVQTPYVELGTLQAGDSFVLDIPVTVVASCNEARLLTQLSWAEGEQRVEISPDFPIMGQPHDIDWNTVELEEPYSLEAIASEDDLIGRKAELTRLIRLANSQTVGSGYICGQKRVGKTSLANAVTEKLMSDPGRNWIIIYKGSGDYVGDDAKSTLQNLGDVLVQAMKAQIPYLANLPSPEFGNGLAPLSGFVDQALSLGDCRLLFVLDEFDELPTDLYRRNELSTSLFQPIRQISNKSGCGFLLVGGESMQQIMSVQGDRLNKFRPVELDYFSRSNDWSDFVELIRRPVQDWLTISDAALDELFEFSAGNPYFAKLLAYRLFSDMVENRYSDASEIDMTNAIEREGHSVAANSFAHFWTDGLVGSFDDTEEARVLRRSVLIAAGRVFRKNVTASYESIWEEFRTASGLPVEEHRFRVTLQDFLRRKILVEDEDGNVTCKIPLFGSWLKGKGVGDLLEDSRELELLKSRLQDEEHLRVSDNEILEFLSRCGHFRYRGRSLEAMAIRRWLEQFETTQEQRLMFKLLSNLRFYDEHTVRAKMHEAFGIVVRNIRTVLGGGARVRYDVLVSSLDSSPAKAGLTYCRLFASENRISSQSVMHVDSLESKLDTGEEVQRLVFVDDFSGTGNTLVEGLRKNLGLLTRFNAAGVRIIVIALVGFDKARDAIEHFFDRNGLDADVYFCDELGPEDRVFSEGSAVFGEPNERELAKQAAEAKGVILERRHPLGYHDSQTSVVFFQSCPNNTLPIFWGENAGWFPLFARM